jgi:Putative restriction endonuclease
VVIDQTIWVEPDVAIWPAGAVDLATGGSVPVREAEVLLPSTDHRDREVKSLLYGRAGVPWLVLAERAAPALEVLKLLSGARRFRW